MNHTPVLHRQSGNTSIYDGLAPSSAAPQGKTADAVPAYHGYYDEDVHEDDPVYEEDENPTLETYEPEPAIVRVESGQPDIDADVSAPKTKTQMIAEARLIAAAQKAAVI